jgi:hypothetical protein
MSILPAVTLQSVNVVVPATQPEGGAPIAKLPFATRLGEAFAGLAHARTNMPTTGRRCARDFGVDFAVNINAFLDQNSPRRNDLTVSSRYPKKGQLLREF